MEIENMPILSHHLERQKIFQSKNIHIEEKIGIGSCSIVLNILCNTVPRHKYIFQYPVVFGHLIRNLRNACTSIHLSVHWKFLFTWKKDRVSQQQKTIKLEWLNMALAVPKARCISFSHLTSVLPSNGDYFHIFACVNELDRCKYFITAYIKHVCALIQHTASNATSNNNKT